MNWISQALDLLKDPSLRGFLLVILFMTNFIPMLLFAGLSVYNTYEVKGAIVALTEKVECSKTIATKE